jgi:hypothetical protein
MHCVTLISNDLDNPFLSPGFDVPEDAPSTPLDASSDDVRRLRNPFAVDPEPDSD